MARRRDGYVPETLRPKKATDLAIVVPPDGIRPGYREFHLRKALAPVESPALCGRFCDLDSLMAPAQWRTGSPNLVTEWCLGCEVSLGGVLATARLLSEQDKDMRVEPVRPPGSPPPEDDYP